MARGRSSGAPRPYSSAQAKRETGCPLGSDRSVVPCTTLRALYLPRRGRTHRRKGPSDHKTGVSGGEDFFRRSPNERRVAGVEHKVGTVPSRDRTVPPPPGGLAKSVPNAEASRSTAPRGSSSVPGTASAGPAARPALASSTVTPRRSRRSGETVSRTGWRTRHRAELVTDDAGALRKHLESATGGCSDGGRFRHHMAKALMVL